MYLIIINLVTFLLYGIDKFFSIKHYYRISEKLLLFFSIIGGSLGALLGSYFFRHKTRKLKFTIINTILFIGQVILIMIWNL